VFGLILVMAASTTATIQFDLGIEGIIEAGHFVTPIEQGSGIRQRAAIVPTRIIVRYLSTNAAPATAGYIERHIRGHTCGIALACIALKPNNPAPAQGKAVHRIDQAQRLPGRPGLAA
jgi:hypothetical protein